MLSEQDPPKWAPYDLDHYHGTSGLALEAKARASAHIETWKAPAGNMAAHFCAIYGSGLLPERLQAIEGFRATHVGSSVNIMRLPYGMRGAR